MTKIYRPSVRYDARFKDYVDRLKETSGLDGAQIIRLALFVSANNPQFAAKIKEYASGREVKMPMPRWNKSDDNMWLSQQGEEDQPRRAHVVTGPSIPVAVPSGGGGVIIKYE